jgi:hypothetical protein
MVESIRNLVKNKRVIFVGNSVEIMNYKLADKINSYDIVVRFGRAIEANKLQEESLGTKVDIWVTGQFRAPCYVKLKEEFKTGKFKDVEILVNRCRGNLQLKDWIFEDRLPKGMPYTQMYSDEEIVSLMKGFDKDMYGDDLRPSAGFITILWFINKIKTYKSLDLVGFDFFAKTVKNRRKDKQGFLSKCDPHSWHLPVYLLDTSAHDMDLEQQYVSFLQRNGRLKWHVLSDLKEEKVKYTEWMQGMKIVKSVPRKSNVSKILPQSQQ